MTDEQWQQFVDAISTGIGGPTQAVVDALQSQGIEVVFANRWMQWYKDTYGVDVILMGANYKLAGLAGIPALTIPTGRAVDQDGKPGQPPGIFTTGPYLSDGQVLAVGYALEQVLNVQLQPDLDAAIQQIEAVTGQ